VSTKQQGQDKDFISRLALAIGVVGGFFASLTLMGASRRDTWKWNRINKWLTYSLLSATIIFSRSRDLPYWMDKLHWIFPNGFAEWLYLHVPPSAQFLVFVILPFLTWLTVIGAFEKVRLQPFQSAIDGLGMKTPDGKTPKVIDVILLGPGLRKIITKTTGFDISEVKNKKAILESRLNRFVQDIRISDNHRGVVEVTVSDRDLPVLIPFANVSGNLIEPYSFLVGDGMTGFIVANFLKIHHLLIAGSTGGGKSFFQKQLLIGLLQSSKHIQLYLIDLKMGVEVKVFERLENVAISKNPVTAIEMLDVVVKEMDRRFEYLEDKGYTEIDPARDKIDRIIVLVDEASDLFTVVRSSKAGRASAENARELADRIAKLGRAAGIHLILATQKVTKQTIDTRVQTNISARMIFRVNDMPASTTVLGNKLAFELPQLGGRGIWSVGSRHILVQTPKLDNDEVATQVTELLKKFNGKESPLFQKMLMTTRKKHPPKLLKETTSVITEGIDTSAGSF
jgi:hypothetical protein